MSHELSLPFLEICPAKTKTTTYNSICKGIDIANISPKLRIP